MELKYLIYSLSLLIACAVHVQSAIIADPPGVDAIQKYSGCNMADDYTPDPYDCTKFYRCAHGFQSAFRCGPGTAFDTSFNGCNYRSSVARCNDFGGGDHHFTTRRPIAPQDDVCGSLSLKGYRHQKS